MNVTSKLWEFRLAKTKISTEADISEYRRLFRYLDGKLIRKVSTSSRARAGVAVGNITGDGHLQVYVNGRSRYVHRIIYEMHNGPIPEGMYVDHVNQIPTDNRIENLRLVTNQENQRNQTRNTNNTSGVTGVYWRKDVKMWQVRIRVSGKLLHVGYFTSFDDAVTARKEAEKQHGFHINHDSEKV